VRSRLAAQQGRFTGIGEYDMDSESSAGDTHTELYALENQDDVLGSGIFDDSRRPATANAEMGVFESHYSLPGYQARQVPFEFSDEVTSLPSGAPYIEVPAGGMAYVEAHGGPVWPRAMGPKPPTPHFMPARPTGRMQPYAHMREDDRRDSKPIDAMGRDSRVAPVMQRAPMESSYHLPERPAGHPTRYPQYRTASVPMKPAMRRLRRRPGLRVVRRRAMGQDEAVEPKTNWTELAKWGAVGAVIGVVGQVVLSR
jgi:hypothetical protein